MGINVRLDRPSTPLPLMPVDDAVLIHQLLVVSRLSNFLELGRTVEACMCKTVWLCPP